MTPARPRPRFIVSRFAEGEIVGVRIVGGGGGGIGIGEQPH